MFDMQVTREEALNIVSSRAYQIGASIDGRATMNPYPENVEAHNVWVDSYRLGCKARPFPEEKPCHPINV